MPQVTSRRRVFLVGGLTLVLLAAVLALPRLAKRAEFATPADCLAAFRDASLDGDAQRYRTCLGGALRGETDRTFADDAKLTASLQAARQGLKHWVETAPAITSRNRATAAVDEVRVTGQRRLRIQMELFPSGWLITRIEREQEKPAPIRYGTAAGDFQRGEDDEP